MTPPALDRVARVCLAKDPEDRWQSAHDVASELKWIAEGSGAGVAVARAPRGRRWKTVAAVLLAGIARFGPHRFRSRPSGRGPCRRSRSQTIRSRSSGHPGWRRHLGELVHRSVPGRKQSGHGDSRSHLVEAPREPRGASHPRHRRRPVSLLFARRRVAGLLVGRQAEEGAAFAEGTSRRSPRWIFRSVRPGVPTTSFCLERPIRG